MKKHWCSPPSVPPCLCGLIPSQLSSNCTTTQFSDSPFDCELNDWAKAGLKAPSFVRLHKLATMEKKLVEKEFGMITAADFQCVLETLRKMNQKISTV